MLAAGARVVLVDRDEAALRALREKHGDAVIPLVIDLLDAKCCATLMSQILEKAGQLDILHANAVFAIAAAKDATNAAEQTEFLQRASDLLTSPVWRRPICFNSSNNRWCSFK
jgi:NADP-dependent 3-hydroxy acid dehydrogenase YdfG